MRMRLVAEHDGIGFQLRVRRAPPFGARSESGLPLYRGPFPSQAPPRVVHRRRNLFPNFAIRLGNAVGPDDEAFAIGRNDLVAVRDPRTAVIARTHRLTRSTNFASHAVDLSLDWTNAVLDTQTLEWSAA